MNIWYYHPETRKLIGQGQADASPLEPGVFLLPAFATDIPPPEIPVNYNVSFTGEGWALEEISTEPEPDPEPQPAPPAVPSQITNFQARALLMRMPGIAEGRTLFQDVDDALARLGGVPWQAWEYTTIFPRNSELIATMAVQFNLTEAQLDEMFIAADQISV